MHLDAAVAAAVAAADAAALTHTQHVLTAVTDCRRSQLPAAAASVFVLCRAHALDVLRTPSFARISAAIFQKHKH